MKLSKKVQHWDDLRHQGDSLIATLHYGNRFEEPGEHVRGFDTVSEARQAVKWAVKCECRECKSAAEVAA